MRPNIPHLFIGLAAVAAITAGALWAQSRPAGPPPPRLHKITEKGQLRLRPAASNPPHQSKVTIEIEGDLRVITANGIPNHKTGQFPNGGNPNTIRPQRHVFKVPAKPKVADEVTPMRGMFGVAINGVPFDPGAGEFYDGAPGWQYEPLSGAIDLGIDLSHAHVQPTGKYHYHGLPTGLLDNVKLDPGRHSPLIGWAADGFPIYALYGYSDSKDADSTVTKLTSSHRLKAGSRPGGDAPGGKYDGTFVADYEFVEGSGDLDECNGRFTVTPDFPSGTYAYYLTEDWPVVPRNYRGTPSADFFHGGPAGPRNGPPRDDRGAGGLPRPGPGQVIPDFALPALDLTENQRAELAALQKLVDERLAKVLTSAELRALREAAPPRPERGGPNRPPRPRGRDGRSDPGPR